MRDRRPRHILAGLMLVLLAPAASAALLLSSSATAAEQNVIENPPGTGTGLCPENGVIGQTFTLQEPGALSSYGFWLTAEDSPAGSTLTATVSVGWWIEGGLRPFVEHDVSFTAPAEPTLTTLTPASPIPLLPGSMFAIALDFHGVGACPVAFSPGAGYAGGFLVVGTQQAEGDLAFQLGLGPVDQQPGPDAPSTIIGDPSTQPATVGCPYSYQFERVGTPAIFVQDFQVPGLELDGNALISGTPTQTGTFSQNVRVFDGTSTDGHEVTVIVNPLPPSGCPAPGAPTPLPPTTSPPAAPVGPVTTTPVPASPTTAQHLPATGADPTMGLMIGVALLAGAGVMARAASVRRRRRTPSS